jgi:hypothetical protein
MQTLDPQQIATILLPFVASIVSYIIQQYHWKDATNATTAGVTIIAAAIVTVILQGKLTGNVYSDALLVVATAAALQSEALAPLQQYLKSIPSSSPAQSEEFTVPPPTPIILPNATKTPMDNPQPKQQ